MERIFENEYFILHKEEAKVFIVMKKEGYDIASFNHEVLSMFGRLRITKFAGLSAAIQHVMNKSIEIGEFAEMISLQVVDDGMKVEGKLQLSDAEFASTDGVPLYECIHQELANLKVIYGILSDDEIHIIQNESFLVAKGKQAIHGQDAIVKYYEIEEAHPTIESKGGVDFYELNVINIVKKDQWVGERIEPTLGQPGVNVFGQVVSPISGQQIPLKYDPKSVYEKYSNEALATYLYAAYDGAIAYVKGAVSVQNAIEVEGNVGFGTGNIDFKGFVDVKGGVEDNFSVIADENIQILGDMGIGAVDTIESRKGDIYIKGGINGRHKAVIRAHGNIYTKYCSDCSIYCENTVNIGFYAMNSTIIAKEVIFEALNSRIFGGEIKAEIKVQVGEIGTKSGRKTIIRVLGFDKLAMEEEYNTIIKTIELLNLKIKEYKDMYDKVTMKADKTEEEVDFIRDKLHAYQERLKLLYASRDHIMSFVRTKGDGEITAKKCIHEQVTLNLGEHVREINTSINNAVSFFLKDREIIQE